MKRLKTILALLLALALVLPLAACGGTESGSGKSKKDDDETSEKDSRKDDADEDEDEDGGRSRREPYALYLKDGELYCSDLSKNGAWQVTGRLYEDADNSQLAYNSYSISHATVISRDGKTLFFQDKLDTGSTLYYRDTSGKKEAVKIDSDIQYFAVNDSAGLVTYLKNNNLYQYSVSRDEKEKLAGDVSSFYVSDDGKKIIFRDDEDTLYQLDSGKEKEKLDSDVGQDYISAISEDCRTIVYRKDETLYLKRDGKEKFKIASDVSSELRAYDTGEVYYYVRDDGDYTLCFFDGKDSTELIDEVGSYSFSCSSETPVVVYQDDDEAYWLAAGGKTSELDAGEPFDFIFSSDGKSLWYIDETDRYDEGELYHVPISDGRAGKAEKLDVDVYIYSIEYAYGHLLYFKDVSDNNEGELYVDGKKVDDDVYFYGLQWSESGDLLYYVDYNANRGYGTLKQYSDGKAVKIEDDVYNASYLPDGSVLYLIDYNTSKYRGDLYVYSGGKSTKLDEDVVAIIPVSGEKYRYCYFHYFDDFDW